MRIETEFADGDPVSSRSARRRPSVFSDASEPMEALTTFEATTPLACVEKRLLRPVVIAGLTYARYLPCPLIAKQLGRCELMRSLSD